MKTLPGPRCSSQSGSIFPERQVARTGGDGKLMSVKDGDIIQKGNCAKTFSVFAGDFVRILK